VSKRRSKRKEPKQRKDTKHSTELQDTNGGDGRAYENRQPPEIPPEEEYTPVDVAAGEHAPEEFYAELGDAEDPAEINYAVTD